MNHQCLLVADAGTWDAGHKRFGEPCAADLECDSVRCVGGPRGPFCTVDCDGGCPSAFVCKQVPTAPDGGALTGLCAVAQPLLCEGCKTDLDCGASRADRCLTSIGGSFCGQDCTYASCPLGTACAGVSAGGRQCQPAGKTCDCVPENSGMQKGCPRSNDAGTCYGAQTCQPDAGWTPCTAPAPAFEVCNGLDDDCDGKIDDTISPRACSRANDAGTCKGTETCNLDGGWFCDAPTPAVERCNYVDDDCNGKVDDGFVDGLGRYVKAQHCGGCGNDCALLVPHATTTTCAVNDAGAPGCRALGCQSGWFLYADAGICLELPSTLCRPCLFDADCVGPGSRCIDLNPLSDSGVDVPERACGRDCTAASPYPACPAGYSCTPLDAGAQCLPVTRTCNCTVAHLGSKRSCHVTAGVQTCKGYEGCALDAGVPAWTVCDVASYNPEICDLVDNDCDTQVDEGYRNASTGKYDQAQNCGFCNNDCTKYWSPTLDHTSGVCDAAPTMPVCKMGPCTTETVAGVTYEWVDVDGDSNDGCECRRVQGNLTTDLPDRAPGVAPAPSYVDQNCDGIDGVIGDALFVSAGASASGTGTRASPFKTLGAAVAAFPASGKKHVLVTEGTYQENVRLTAGVQLFGGYSSDFKARDPLLHATVLEGQAPTAAAVAAIDIENVAVASPQTVVSGFVIHGQDVAASTPDGQDGAPTYAVYVKDSGAGVQLTNNEIVAGRGGKGGRGLTGGQGYGRQSSLSLNGTSGFDSGRVGSICSGFSQVGGTGGVNSLCATGNAPAGGGVVCPVFNWVSVTGAQAQYTTTANGNGLGGYDWSFDTQSGTFCAHATESGFPSSIQDHVGHDGAAGADGLSGSGGAGAPASARHGSFFGSRWVRAPSGGGAGSLGSVAKGGGGGGAGGGTARYPTGGCLSYEYGATGGGGGAGACGGGGGQAGRAGGASIAVLVVWSAVSAQQPLIQGNRIQRNFGGGGGNGGFGGAGGLGGAGGFGGNTTTWSGSVGGKGGEGGNGGAGGGGGGGAGGPSFGILAFNTGVATWAAQNTFVTAAASDTSGAGGSGGSSSGPGATGAGGTAGAFADVLSLTGCPAGCPGGTTCDANGVCAPN